MANIKITDLTAYTDPAATDVLPIVDVGDTLTKKVTIENLLKNAGSGTAAAPGIAFDGDSNTGIYRPGADQLALSTSGTKRIEIQADGDIDIDGGGVFYDATNNRLAIGTTSPTQLLDLESATGGRIAFTDTGSRRWSIGTPAGGSTSFSIYDESGASEALRITSTGSVGIGTTSPINPLEVNYSSATQTALRLLNTDTTATAVCGLEFDVSNGASGGLLYIDSAVSGGSPYNIHLKRGQSSSAICFDSSTTEHARIDSSGRLLVGTSSDSGGALLQVNGNRIRVATAKTPSSASDTGTTGEICWDASYIYVCTATNTWKRAALATW